jgi:hypothetical protein
VQYSTDANFQLESANEELQCKLSKMPPVETVTRSADPVEMEKLKQLLQNEQEQHTAARKQVAALEAQVRQLQQTPPAPITGNVPHLLAPAPVRRNSGKENFMMQQIHNYVSNVPDALGDSTKVFVQGWVAYATNTHSTDVQTTPRLNAAMPVFSTWSRGYALLASTNNMFTLYILNNLPVGIITCMVFPQLLILVVGLSVE